MPLLTFIPPVAIRLPRAARPRSAWLSRNWLSPAWRLRPASLSNASGLMATGLLLLGCTPSNPLATYMEGTGGTSTSMASTSDAGQAGSAGAAGSSGMAVSRPSTTIPDAGNGSAGAADLGTDAGAPVDSGIDPVVSDAGNCTGATEFSNAASCYLVVTTTSTWQAARDNCVDWGGQLVTIETTIEDTLLAAQTPDFDFWIGYNDLETEGDYVWVSGAPGEAAGGFENWQAGLAMQAPQPSDLATENCVAALRAGDGWYDLDCSEADTYGSVCERAL